MKCHECPHWHKELEACQREHTDCEDLSCLLKMIIWMLAVNYEDDEGEDWKLPPIS